MTLPRCEKDPSNYADGLDFRIPNAGMIRM